MKRTHPFRVGDVVALNSSPEIPMTVIHGCGYSVTDVECKWFKKNHELVHAVFDCRTLHMYEVNE